MKKNARYSIYNPTSEVNFNRGSSYEEVLYNELIDSHKLIDFTPLYKKVEEIFSDDTYIDRGIINKENITQDDIYRVFELHVKLDYDFAKQLNMLDVVGWDCFLFEKEEGEVLRALLDSADLLFVVAKKTWRTKDKIDIEFEATDTDFQEEAINNIKLGNSWK